ncbi:uncharacterized protein LOC121808945 [Salvia splendens]|uniref:uncharacterized protein LOC121808945 n=1 Tax=Salvia splendens TaxID=180675 RepID=UPI001C274CFB|nr:uncharacterized protein LOC121808945 [Salvia splendens]
MVLDGKGKKKSSTTSSISLLFPSTAKHVRSASQIDTDKCTHPCAASIFLKLTSESFNLNANSVAGVIYRRFNWEKRRYLTGFDAQEACYWREEEGVEEEAKIIEKLVFAESFMEEEEERQMKARCCFCGNMKSWWLTPYGGGGDGGGGEGTGSGGGGEGTGTGSGSVILNLILNLI